MSTQEQRLADIRYQHIRHIIAHFLNDTKALYLERDLVDFLARIDETHQEEVRVLKLQLKALL